MENGDVALTLEILARVKGEEEGKGTPVPLYPLLLGKTYNGEGRGQNRDYARVKNKG